MLDIVSILCLFIALALLIALVVIDLKVQLLPNILVLGLALSGFAFHSASLFYYIPVNDMALGAFIGGGTLALIRAAGNAFYKDETLGLGDVKLMAAGGLWLGSYFILIALISGALAGITHGAVLMLRKWIKTRNIESFSRFSLPAGPGFAVGILIAGLAKLSGLPHLWS